MKDDELLSLLRQQGFEDPVRWMDYARAHGFRRVAASRLEHCPHCGGDRHRFIGSYIHYSHRASLLACRGCGLWYSDLRLNSDTVAAHFERVYKDEEYFVRDRAPIFAELVDLVAGEAPHGGRVLDVGGAKGHLLSLLADARPDLELTLSDLSREACRHARDEFGLEAVRAGIADLAGQERKYDVIILADVIYYEPDIDAVWRLLETNLSPGGLVVLRVPNKSCLIRLQPASGARDGSLRAFNPEHLYVFTRDYLERQLRVRGFEDVRVRASRLLGTGVVRELAYRILKAVGDVAGGRALTPSMVVVARASGDRGLRHRI